MVKLVKIKIGFLPALTMISDLTRKGCEKELGIYT